MLNTFQNPRVSIGLAVALIVGFVVGFAIAWNVPASDLAPVHLQKGYRDYYLALVADEYSRTHDLDTARSELGADNRGDKGYWTSAQVAAALRDLDNLTCILLRQSGANDRRSEAARHPRPFDSSMPDPHSSKRP